MSKEFLKDEQLTDKQIENISGGAQDKINDSDEPEILPPGVDPHDIDPKIIPPIEQQYPPDNPVYPYYPPTEFRQKKL